ncbi:MAG: hypothetical protein HKN47_18545 [Pirellulaceae bacterium]|nr:hypothetical protein [Pirellulaceae bacterium]
MDELIQKLTSQLGIDATTASAATNKAMAMVKDNVGADLFAKIEAQVPGASAAASAGATAEPAAGAEAAAPAGGGGLLGSLAGMASGALGGSGGGALGMAAALSSTGLKTDQLGGFVATVIEFLKEKVGDDVVNQILAKVPMLKGLAG